MYPFLIGQLADAVAGEDLVVIDATGALEPILASAASLYVGKALLNSHAAEVKAALTDLAENGTGARRCIGSTASRMWSTR
ncbi:hypothetical protein ASF88_03790 [Leifsonia sp. Leaf336]|uniref:hypothetical protein n=1 Tax=Leifsonia sp. Leaf336 TaxID=1736341 RepID=UPI0006FE566F|nr:hypothetical protein [Leifsonia sp. Leaf336]KQR53972.1 hypothetical protein ASF88_03790 [Leifsonia sp. Leaf336]